MSFNPKYPPAPRDLALMLSSEATLSALKSVSPKLRFHGLRKTVENDLSEWWFHDSSVLTGDDILVVTPDQGIGRWLRRPGRAVLRMPITFATLDAAALLTLQAGCELRPWEFYWEISTNWTGGSSPTIGLSSNKTGYSTKGDLLGGAAGDAAAALTTALSPAIGTIGAKRDADDLRAIWVPTNNFRFDRITDAFAAGAGNAVAVVDILKNAGA